MVNPPKEDYHDSVYSKVSCAEYQSGQTLYSVAYKDDKDLCTLSFIYMYYQAHSLLTSTNFYLSPKQSVVDAYLPNCDQVMLDL